MGEDLWAAMVAYADAKGLKKGDYKKLNLPFEPKLLGQPAAIRERMAKRVEDFVYNMLVNVLNASDTAPLLIQAILEAGGYDPGPKANRIESAAQWTPEKIAQRGAAFATDKGPKGHFDD
jgi:fructose-bisphosphate aldolase class II